MHGERMRLVGVDVAVACYYFEHQQCFQRFMRMYPSDDGQSLVIQVCLKSSPDRTADTLRIVADAEIGIRIHHPDDEHVEVFQGNDVGRQARVNAMSCCLTICVLGIQNFKAVSTRAYANVIEVRKYSFSAPCSQSRSRTPGSRC